MTDSDHMSVCLNNEEKKKEEEEEKDIEVEEAEEM